MIAVRGGSAEVSPLLPPGVICASLGALSIAVITGTAIKPVLALTLGTVIIAVWYRSIFTWRSMIGLIIGVILFIPIRRYALPGSLPFQLEPYRVLIGLVVVFWIAGLLGDPRIRFSRSWIDAPLAMIFVVSAASVAANIGTIAELHVTSAAIKQLTFLASFLLLFYLLVGLMRRLEDIDTLLRILVGGGAVVAVSALFELWTKFNIFNHLERILPFLHATNAPVEAIRGGHIRVLASAQHPIALGALFVMLIPIAIYLAYLTGQRRWWVATALFGMAALGTASRTAVVMLVASIVVYLVLRRRETIRLWPALIPMIIMIHFAMPGVIGGFYKAFFPKGGLGGGTGKRCSWKQPRRVTRPRAAYHWATPTTRLRLRCACVSGRGRELFHRRRPVAINRNGDRYFRNSSLGVAVYPGAAANIPSRPRRSRPTGMAVHRDCGCSHRVCSRHADLRCLLIHSDDRRPLLPSRLGFSRAS